MLTIAEASGLIAAVVMIGMWHMARSYLTDHAKKVQYALPAALIIIMVKYVGTENRAVTWYVSTKLNITEY
jgi:hypothetical protein